MYWHLNGIIAINVLIQDLLIFIAQAFKTLHIKEIFMTKVLVLYYSSYGHIAKMAEAVAEGARAGGAEVDIRRVPETAPEEVVKASGFVTDTHEVIESPDVLAAYDAIIVGAPTRFGRMPGA